MDNFICDLQGIYWLIIWVVILIGSFDIGRNQQIIQVMREWSDLEARYKKMKKTDEKGAEAFKKEMTSRFQKTVRSLQAISNGKALIKEKILILLVFDFRSLR